MKLVYVHSVMDLDLFYIITLYIHKMLLVHIEVLVFI